MEWFALHILLVVKINEYIEKKNPSEVMAQYKHSVIVTLEEFIILYAVR